MNWKNSVDRCDAKWVLDQRQGKFEPALDGTLEYLEIPSDIGRCDGYFYTLPLGSTLSTFNHTFNDRAPDEIQPLMDARKDFDEPTLIIMHTEQGQVIIDDNLSPRRYSLNAGRTHFQFVQTQDYSVEIDTKEDIHSVKLMLSQSLLKSLLGEETCRQLFHKLGFDKVPSDISVALPPQVNMLLKDCINNLKEGAAESVAIQGRVLIYLSALTNHILAPKQGQKNIRHVNIAKALHDEIIAMQGRIPGLAYFSEKYGLSTKSLNESFKGVYQQTIWAFISDHRLTQAHTALSESDTAIKTIADQYGYANVSHFANAFKNKYGHPPGQLRKAR